MPLSLFLLSSSSNLLTNIVTSNLSKLLKQLQYILNLFNSCEHPLESLFLPATSASMLSKTTWDRCVLINQSWRTHLRLWGISSHFFSVRGKPEKNLLLTLKKEMKEKIAFSLVFVIFQELSKFIYLNIESWNTECKGLESPLPE